MKPLARLVIAAWAMLLAATPLAAADAPRAVVDALAKLADQPPDRLGDAPMTGWYEAVFGAQVFYVSADGRYVLAGSVIDLETLENLTESTKNALRQEAVDALGEENMVVFAPEDPEHTVTVFTDTRCGYCQKLHREVAVLNEAGVKVRYLAFPAISPQSRPEMIAVWCAEDPQQAMTDAKAGKPIERKSCANPVDEHFRVGRELGVRGTPAIVLGNGDLMPGYLPAKELLKRIEMAGR